MKRAETAVSRSAREAPGQQEYFDDRETLSPEVREQQLMARLPRFLEHAVSKSETWASRLNGVRPQEIVSREALARLPVLRKSEIAALQAERPPLGGLATRASGKMQRLFMSPGSVYEPQGHGQDPWRTARALWAAGVRPGQVLMNCFSYHLTPGAWLVDAAAMTIGAAVIPAGVGNTEQQLQAMAHYQPQVYVGTPSFLRILIERAQAAGGRFSTPRTAVVSGEALPEALRTWFREQGVERVRQWYGTADAGTIAFESSDGGGMILEEDILLEVVKPGTGEPVADGEIGEIVVTNFNPDYPMIRFATGDLTAILPGASSCGRTNTRIRGWLGRADDGVKVRGMFIYPMHVQQLLQRLDFLARARLVVSGEMGRDELAVECELKAGIDRDSEPAVKARIVDACRSVTKLRATPILLPAGTLAEDARLVVDTRRVG